MHELKETDKILSYIVAGNNRLEKRINDETYYFSTGFVFTPPCSHDNDLIAEIIKRLLKYNLINEHYDEFRSGGGEEIFFYAPTIEGITFSKNEGFEKNEIKRSQKEEKENLDFIQAKRNVYFWRDPKFLLGLGIGLLPFIYMIAKEHFHF